jgi:hypothetical protein
MKNTLKTILGISLCAVLILIYSCSNTTTPVTPPTTITVNGKVLDAYGYQINAATVVIGAQHTTTAGDGSFTINNVTAPYDAYALSTNGVFGIKGLTIANPYLQGGILVTPPPPSSLSVTIPIVPVGSRATIMFQDTITGKVGGFGQIPQGQTTALVNMGGTMGQPLAGKVYVIEYTISGNPGVVGTYTGYAEQTASFNYGTGTPITFISLSGGLGMSTVSGTVNSSGGTGLIAQLYISFGSKNNITHRGGFIQNIPITGNSGSFTFNVPTGTTTSANLNVVAITPNPPNSSVAQRMKTLTAGSSGAVISIDTLPTLITPSNSASNVDTTTMFTYTNGGGNGLHIIRFTPTGLSGNFFQIVTKGTSLTIPNFSAYGYTLGTTASYTWLDNSKIMDINTTDDYSSQSFELNPAIVATTQSATFTFTSR